MGEVLGIIMVSFVLPLIIVLHYMTKWKESKGLSREDEKMLEEIWESLCG